MCRTRASAGAGTRVTVLFSGPSAAPWTPWAARTGRDPSPAPRPRRPAATDPAVGNPAPVAPGPTGPPHPTPFRHGGPNAPRFTGPRERTGAVVRRKLCARRDWNPRTQPLVFSQLHILAEPFAEWPEGLPPTRQEETARYAFTRRGRATFAKGTSLCASRVERFVIERFTPRFLIDIAPVGEGVTAGPRDAVDSILKIGDWGNVRNRGETCRSGRPVGTRETRTPRGA